MAYRAEKSGLARDAANKVAQKWDNNAAVTAMTWVAKNTEIPLPDGYCGDMRETHLHLKDGYVLVKLANWAKDGSVKPALMSKRPTLAFKQMELIGVFLDVLKKHNLVQEMELFQTVDLFEEVNMPAVITTIESLGRKLQSENRGFGKGESVGEKKNWTDEQLKAGQNIIGLQMGTNKGANQSGINIGKSRAIMD